MKPLIKPIALQKGDTVATVSLSWGGAGLFTNRYYQGKSQFEKAFDVHIVEMSHTLDTPDDIYKHPEHRLDDLMSAFQDDNIKAILTTIGGDDTIRLLRLMNEKHFDIIRNNPKIFLGMSDTTVNHFMCLKAGISSFYSPSLMFGYAENGGIPQDIIKNTESLLFNTQPIGVLSESSEFIIEQLDWNSEAIMRKRLQNTPWRYIQGQEIAQGRLIGGCMDVLDFLNATSLWPESSRWQDTILFFETSEDCPTPAQVLYWLRNLATQGILNQINGILFGRPDSRTNNLEQYYTESIAYDNVILQVLKEYDLTHIPVVTNVDFGHTVPQLIFPYGLLTEINPQQKTVSFLEPAVR